jgi:hypothetical protein
MQIASGAVPFSSRLAAHCETSSGSALRLISRRAALMPTLDPELMMMSSGMVVGDGAGGFVPGARPNSTAISMRSSMGIMGALGAAAEAAASAPGTGGRRINGRLATSFEEQRPARFRGGDEEQQQQQQGAGAVFTPKPPPLQVTSGARMLARCFYILPGAVCDPPYVWVL